MKPAAILALLAVTVLADDSKLTVRVELPVETLSEGETALARSYLKNEGNSSVVLLAFESEDGAATRAGDVSFAVSAVGVKLSDDRTTMEVDSGRSRGLASRPFPDVVAPLLLESGGEIIARFGLEAPGGHTYGLHFRVTYLPLDRAVAENRVFVLDEEERGTDVSVYRSVDSLKTLPVGRFHKARVLIRLDPAIDPNVAHAAIAVEVRPREFSFADAAKEAGVVPERATWFEPRGLWALAAAEKTYLIAKDTRIELLGDHVPFLSELRLSGYQEVFLPSAEDDEFAKYLRIIGAREYWRWDGMTGFYVLVHDLPEVLQKADELGFIVTQGGWKKRE